MVAHKAAANIATFLGSLAQQLLYPMHQRKHHVLLCVVVLLLLPSLPATRVQPLECSRTGQKYSSFHCKIGDSFSTGFLDTLTS